MKTVGNSTQLSHAVSNAQYILNRLTSISTLSLTSISEYFCKGTISPHCAKTAVKPRSIAFLCE